MRTFGVLRTFGVRSSDDVTQHRSEQDELRRARFARFARFAKQTGLEELDHADLTFGRYWVVHEPTGDRYTVYRGNIDAGPVHPVSACYAADVFLERLPGKRP